MGWPGRSGLAAGAGSIPAGTSGVGARRPTYSIRHADSANAEQAK